MARLPDGNGSKGHAPVHGYFETGRQRNAGDEAGHPAAGGAGGRADRLPEVEAAPVRATASHRSVSRACALPISTAARWPSRPRFQRDAAVSADAAARLTRHMPMLAGAVAANPNC